MLLCSVSAMLVQKGRCFNKIPFNGTVVYLTFVLASVKQ
uniref:Uncharacterized protein n=1 Tax=Anguilla anguilla TaxID=7936 RepID=A0A0E9V3L7_ANGAN